jgi:hypothetical protein
MRDRLAWIRHRLVPAMLTAAGVTLVATGLLTYTRPATAVSPEPTTAATVRPSPVRLALPTLAPSGAASAAPTTRVPTRIVVPSLGIDLAVINAPAGETFPSCGVAEYVEPGPAAGAQQFSRPGEPGTTYIYAHARTGMFLPLLDGSQRNDGAAMKGMIVQVYTSDDQEFLYEVTQVRRHQDSLAGVVTADREQLALQTSEGPPKGYPGYTGLVLIVVARPLSSSPADHAAANPAAHPVACQ